MANVDGPRPHSENNNYPLRSGGDSEVRRWREGNESEGRSVFFILACITPWKSRTSWRGDGGVCVWVCLIEEILTSWGVSMRLEIKSSRLGHISAQLSNICRYCFEHRGLNLIILVITLKVTDLVCDFETQNVQFSLCIYFSKIFRDWKFTGINMRFMMCISIEVVREILKDIQKRTKNKCWPELSQIIFGGFMPSSSFSENRFTLLHNTSRISTKQANF